jgi:hypothetical protein
MQPNSSKQTEKANLGFCFVTKTSLNLLNPSSQALVKPGSNKANSKF